MTDVQEAPDAYAIRRRAFQDGEPARARATATPQPMYVELAAKEPVLVDEVDGSRVLLTMADILYVNKHRDVETAAKFLGSNRRAIPLGLDGLL